MLVELIIEGTKADLNDVISADLTYSLADIRTPDKRQVNYSKTLTLPGTATNDFIFGNIFDIDIENPANDPAFPNIGVNYTPKKLAKAVLIADGMQIFDGTLRLWKVILKGGANLYEISLFGKLFDLFGELGDLKLTDLDFSDLNHAVTWGAIVGTWGDDFDYAFRYPLIDYAVNDLDIEGRISQIALGSLVPCIHYKVYLDRIFSSIGGLYTLNFSDRTIFDKMLITPPKPIMSSIPQLFESTMFQVPFTSTIVLTPFFYHHLKLSHGTVANSIFTVTDTGFSNGEATANYVFNTAVSTSLQIRLDVQQTGTPPTYNGIVVYHYSAATGVSNIVGSYSLPVSETNRVTGVIEIERTDFAVNDYLHFTVLVQTGTILTFFENTKILAASPSDTSEYPILPGTIYEMSNSVPLEIKQTDFIKDFIKLFNLFVTQDPDNPKLYIFTPQPDFYLRDTTQVIDWTKKVDRSEEITFTPIGQLTAKEYIFTWKNDKDYWTDKYFQENKEVYGQVTFISDTDILNNKEKVEFLFSPAVMTRFRNSAVLCPAIYKVETVGGFLTRKPDKFNSRLLIWGGLQDAGQIIELLNFDGTQYGNVSEYPYAGHIDHPVNPTFDLNFGNVNAAIPTATVNQFSRYWGKALLANVSKDGKLVSCTMYLTPSDISVLSFAALYKVDFQYFRLNNISGYDPFELGTSKVELIKVISL
ncbi:MAG: hypothetical protein ABIU30_18565 [Ferruginibacter sp.]